MQSYFYWANLTMKDKATMATNLINLPINSRIFHSVREDIYTGKVDPIFNPELLTNPFIWINGFQDLIMGGTEALYSKKRKTTTTFYQSGHYPHIEEAELFCEIVNDFILT